MKNIYLEVSLSNTNSLPDYFKPQQYINTSLKDNDTTKVGNIGQLEYSFLVDAKHPYENAETESNIWLNNILTNGKSFISKATLEQKFYVIEIDDYSHQSMSTGYTDFVPLVFKNGKKIKQKYISIIKYFTTKKAFILVDKKISLSQLDSISILIAFKDMDRNDNEIRTKNKSVVLEKISNSIYRVTMENNKNNKKFLFSFQNKNINDYYITYINSENKEKRINPVMIKSFDIDFDNNKIRKQGNYFTLVAKNRNISKNGDETILENGNLTITVEFYNPISVGNNITLYSRSVLTDVYVKTGKTTGLNFDEAFSTDVWYFDADGKKTTDKENYYELIPQYDNRRIISFKANSNLYTIKALLNNQVRPEIYRWNLYDPEILCFSGDGLFKGSKTYDYIPAVNDEIIIYDGLEPINESLRSTTRIGASNLIEDLVEYVNSNKIEYSTDNGLSVLHNNEDRFESNDQIISFYAMTKTDANNDNFYKTKFYVLMKYYPVYYEEYKVNDYTVYYKLPDNIIDNLNKELYNSMSPRIFIERDENFNDDIYLVNLNEIHYDGTLIKSKLTIKILNFADIKTNTDYDNTKLLTLSDEKNSNKLYFKYGEDYVKDLNNEDLEYIGPKQYYVKLNGDDNWYPTNIDVSSSMDSYEIRSMDYIENEGKTNERIIKVKGLIEKTFGEFNRLVPIIYKINDEDKVIPYNKGISTCIKKSNGTTITTGPYDTILIAEHAIVTP